MGVGSAGPQTPWRCSPTTRTRPKPSGNSKCEPAPGSKLKSRSRSSADDELKLPRDMLSKFELGFRSSRSSSNSSSEDDEPEDEEEDDDDEEEEEEADEDACEGALDGAAAGGRRRGGAAAAAEARPVGRATGAPFLVQAQGVAGVGARAHAADGRGRRAQAAEQFSHENKQEMSVCTRPRRLKQEQELLPHFAKPKQVTPTANPGLRVHQPAPSPGRGGRQVAALSLPAPTRRRGKTWGWSDFFLSPSSSPEPIINQSLGQRTAASCLLVRSSQRLGNARTAVWI
ncbi:rRNA biogenesis protein rrp36-like [Cervus canadensis]|uniref:rRNA biogenesis protein rrp36-like n=1 Tax=Cervus canadensis TaxID=1574408 RepID=UPI001CA32EA2|nr:rRNA biogenesis protein rrp36-like [Cervus canadensis]